MDFFLYDTNLRHERVKEDQLFLKNGQKWSTNLLALKKPQPLMKINAR